MARSSLIRNSIVFGSAEVLNRALPFLLLPLLTRVLSAAEYGLVSTFTVLVSIMSSIAGLSSHGSVNVAYFRLSRDELPEYVGSVLTVLASSTVVVAVAIGLLAPVLQPWTGFGAPWLLAALAVASMQFVTLVNLVLWQAEEKSVAHSVYQFGQALTTTLLSLALVVVWRFGWRGQVLAVLTATTLFALVSLVVLSKRGMLRRPKARVHVMDALRFGAPLVPHELAGWLITGLDRLYLTALVGASSSGVYAAAYQVGLIVSVPAAAFNRAWVPYLFRQLADAGEAGRRRVVQITYLYFAVILAGTGVLTVVSRIVLPHVLGPAFTRSATMVGWIALGYAFNGMYLMVVNQLFYEKKTGWLGVATVVAGLIHAVVSYLLIRQFGARGAAIATTVSFALMFFSTWVMSARACPMPWGLGRRRVAVSEMELADRRRGEVDGRPVT